MAKQPVKFTDADNGNYKYETADDEQIKRLSRLPNWKRIGGRPAADNTGTGDNKPSDAKPSE